MDLDFLGREPRAFESHRPDVKAIRVRRMQKDQLRAAHTIPPSHSGRQASSRRGNPAGGSVGSRHRQQLNSEFIAALLRDFRHGGPKAIERVRRAQPASYMKILALLVPREDKLEHTNAIGQLSDEKLVAMIAELRRTIRAGQGDVSAGGSDQSYSAACATQFGTPKWPGRGIMSKVLYVDDNDDNVYMLKMRLELLGDFEVITADDGQKGCEMVCTERPDIVLMDLEMPGISGWEAAKRIKSNPETRDIPVLALSAHALAGERDKALAAGCDEFDTKPVEFDRLVAKLRRLLSSKIGGAARAGDTTE
jgi:CheY-like chemotaxis protein